MSKLEALVNPFGDSENQNPDTVKKVELTADKKVEKLYSEYMQGRLSNLVNTNGPPTVEIPYLRQKTEILKPLQIELLLQKIIQSPPIEHIKNRYTGWFLSDVIHNSYEAGNNDFILTTNDFDIDGLCAKLEATKRKRIRVTVNGNAGFCFAQASKYCDFNVKGSVPRPFCGRDAGYCVFNIEKNVHTVCGSPAFFCMFNIKGNAASFCANNGWECTYNIDGDIKMPAFEGAYKCILNHKGSLVGNDVVLGMHAEDCKFNLSPATDARTLRILRSYLCANTDGAHSEVNILGDA